jgi:cytochrome c oxidase cbb3-type subunit 2
MAFLFAGLLFRAAARESDAVDRGREVYLAEGCINCHSQYIRPRVAADVERWGPASTLSDRLDAAPPLLGNRRQGPDLSNVGLRRSPVWNRLHLITPRTIAPGSVMPAYAHLFVPGDSRGPDLLTYLSSLGTGMAVERFDFVSVWRPVGLSLQTVAPNEKLFLRLCANCHGPTGQGDGILARQLEPAPPDWTRGARRFAAPGEDPLLFLCRLIKFGLPGTAMAGHEYLPDEEVIGLARVVLGLQDHAPTSAGR